MDTSGCEAFFFDGRRSFLTGLDPVLSFRMDHHAAGSGGPVAGVALCYATRLRTSAQISTSPATPAVLHLFAPALCVCCSRLVRPDGIRAREAAGDQALRITHD